MKTTIRLCAKTAVISISLFALPMAGYCMGSDHPKDRPVHGSNHWPKGMSDLANVTNRVHGFFVNAQDVFFFSGSAADFAQFLQMYADIRGVVAHKLVVHPEKGVAKSPWDEGEGTACDWKLIGYPEAWMEKDSTKKGYVLEVHLYVGGNPQLEKVPVPKGVTVVRAK